MLGGCDRAINYRGEMYGRDLSELTLLYLRLSGLSSVFLRLFRETSWGPRGGGGTGVRAPGVGGSGAQGAQWDQGFKGKSRP